MKIVTSLSVKRMHGDSRPFWPHGVQRLVVVVINPDRRNDTLVAYGIDPTRDHVVFEAELRPAQLSAFIKAVIDGVTFASDHDTAALAGAEMRVLLGGGSDGNAVVLPDPDPHPTGPKISVAYARTIDAANTLANEVSY